MRNLKRVLALMTVFAMVMSVSAFAASWWHDDAPDQKTDNVSVSSALSGIGSEKAGTVQLDGSHDGSGEVTVAAGQNVTLDLNGKTYDGKITDNGSLTVKDSGTDGKINSTDTGLEVKDGGKLEVKDGSIDAKWGVVVREGGEATVTGDAKVSGTSIALQNSGAATVSGNASVTGAYGIYSFGNDNAVVNVTGGKVEGNNNGVVVMTGTATVSGGEVVGKSLGGVLGAINVNGANAKVTLKDDGKITATGDGYGVTLWNGAEFEMTGGSITSENNPGVGNNGSKDQNNTTMTITGGSITSTNGSAIYHPGIGTLTIGGDAEITGYDAGVGIKAGTLTIKDNATVKATGPDSTPTTGYSNGINASGAAIQIEANDGYGKSSNNAEGVLTGITVNISGNSKIISENGHYIYEYIGVDKNGNVLAADTHVNEINISGGTFTGSGEKGIQISQELANDNAIRVSGGTFSTDVTGYLTNDDLAQDANGTVYSQSARAAAIAAARQAAAEEAARLAAAQAAALAGDDSSDDLAPATAAAEAPAEATIEEEATPLAAMPEELAEVTAEDAVDAAIELGIIAEDSYVAEEAAQAETVAEAISILAGDEAVAEEVVAAAEEAGVSFEGEITRDELITVLFTLAEKQGFDVSARADLSDFTDAEMASEAMKWAVEIGLIGGMGDGTLAPTDTLTQEQLLIILARFMALTK